jgi:hypothetical protein
MWQFSKYGFELGFSKIWNLQFWFYHIFSNSRTSRPGFWIRSGSMYTLHILQC